MWGRKKHNDGLDTFYGVYEDLVCRSSTLPRCEAVLSYPKLDEPRVRSGEVLAHKVAQKSAGLDRHGFLVYLEWLLGNRSIAGSYEKDRELPITLFGTSFVGGVKSREFKNFLQLEAWAEPFIASYKLALAAATPDPAPEPPSTSEDDNSGSRHRPSF
ncbi:hypothetical protein PproGo58_30370 [Pseudomonas protegens]|nr:hypothetical protein PproGo58_30370 [Pseudomonas protegens]